MTTTPPPLALPGPLVSTAWLATHLEHPDLVLLDASWTLPGVTPDAATLFARRHIPGARAFDLDAISAPPPALPHSLPDAETFATHAARLGITPESVIVVHDTPGLMSAGRAWWMLKRFGLARVAVLDGGLNSWTAEGRPLAGLDHPGSAEAPHAHAARASFSLDPRGVADLARLRTNLVTRAAQVIDARSTARFAGEAPEPRPGLRAGHVPGSRNLPFDQLTDPETGRLLDRAELRRRFEAAGLVLDRPVITTCGSGITAGALAFALHLLGQEQVALYDGSWAEWGQPGDTPVETGPGRQLERAQ